MADSIQTRGKLAPRHGRAVVAAMLCALAGAAVQAAGDDVLPLDRPALAVRHPLQVAVLAMTRAGASIVAVGERGVVLVSEDQGAHWQQAQIPVSVTLTAVHFVDARTGWACGHGGVLLHTVDGGQTWARQIDGRALSRQAAAILQATPPDAPAAATLKVLSEPVADKPFLDLAFSDARTGFAVGAYGLFVRTRDGGQSWQVASNVLPNPKALHLNAIVVRGKFVLIAGEQGSVFVSTNGGDTFAAVTTPYRGSFFAAALSAGGAVALAGLRGNLVLGAADGQSWSAVKLPTDAGVTVLEEHDAAHELLVGAQSGQRFAVDLRAGSTRELPGRAAPMLTTWVELDGGITLTAGLHGIASDTHSPSRP
jgi:photosystem II stability/assembly factor-like uncharacterized protein